MELLNDFTVNVPIDEAWVTLTDVERIAPCLPGAQLEEIEGDVYRGKVKVKVGPILAQFKGQATFVEKDDIGHKAVLKAEGRETGGKGNASALITAYLLEEGPSTTKVTVKTDLTITGKVAQFGRGALADVSIKLLNQFVEQLETTVLADTPSRVVAAAAEGAQAAAAVADEAAADAEHFAGHAQEAAERAAKAAEEAKARDLEAHLAAEHAAEVGTANGDQPAPPVKRIINSPEAEPVDLMATAGAPIAKRVLPVVGALVALLLVVRWLRRR
jgi:carbon monoxide dehydrogenase subunit G